MELGEAKEEPLREPWVRALCIMPSRLRILNNYFIIWN